MNLEHYREPSLRSEPAANGLGSFLLRNFVVYNPLFLFSAMAVLGSAWLLNPPAASGGRGLGLLVKLAAVIQLYELTLLGAAALLARRGELARDVRNLHLVLAPFLLDVTFTTSCLSVSAFKSGGLLAASVSLAVLVLAAIKLRVGLYLCGRSFSLPQQAVLLAGPVLVTLTPLLGSLLAQEGLSPAVALVAGCGAGGLAALFGACAGREGAAASLRALAPLALVGGLVHGAATAYTYTSPLLWVAGPLLLALARVAHRLWPARVPSGHSPQAMGLAALGVLFCAIPEQGPSEGPRLLTQLALLAFSLNAGVAFARTRSLGHLLLVLAGLRLAAGSGRFPETLAQLGEAPVEPLLLLALSAFGLWRKSSPLATGTPLALAALLIAKQGWLPGHAGGVLAAQLFGAGLLAIAHRHHGTRVEGAQLRFVGAQLLIVPAYALLVVQDGPAASLVWQARGAALGLLLLAGLSGLRGYAWPALLLPVELFGRHAPSSAEGWGVLGMVAAFGVVGAGVYVSLNREQLLARLSEGAARPRPLPNAGAGRRAALRLGGVAALALTSLALAAPNVQHDRDRAQRVAAIGSLKTIATAQALYRECPPGDELIYAPDLAALGQRELIDSILASGEKQGYRFVLHRSPQEPELRWVALAHPAHAHRFMRREWRKGMEFRHFPRDEPPRFFAIDQRGVLMASYEPIELTPEQTLPGDLLVVSQ